MSQTLPADLQDMNAARAAYADAALHLYQGLIKAFDENALTDLLCDLMHWSDRNDISFATELRRARSNYKAETTREPGISGE